MSAVALSLAAAAAVGGAGSAATPSVQPAVEVFTVEHAATTTAPFSDPVVSAVVSVPTAK